MNTHLKGVVGFCGVFEIAFWFIVDILHYVQKGSGYTLRSISYQELIVSPASSELVDLHPNLWYNHSRDLFLFTFLLFLQKKIMFSMHTICKYCRVLLVSWKENHEKPLMKSPVCNELIRVILESDWSCKSGENSTLSNVEIIFSIIIAQFYLDFPCLFCWDEINICNFNVFNRLHQ